jgi:ankyrin repeat protein
MNSQNHHHRISSSRAATVLLLSALPWLLVGCGDSAEQAQQRAEALLVTAERGDIGALDALLGRNPDTDVRDSCDWTPLMKAALNGHRDAAKRLLSAGAAVDAMDKGGYTALMLAASNNHADVIDLLVERGAMIDAQERTQGFTALIWAAQRGHADAVATLLRHGADATLPDLEAKTAADRARAEDHAAVLALLAGPSGFDAAR